MPQVIAETHRRPRMDAEGMRWWTYRVRRMSDSEYEEFHRTRPHSPIGMHWVLETQTHRTDGSPRRMGEPEKIVDEPWQMWNLGETPDSAIWGVIGDTQFAQARSLHLAHAEAVKLASDRARVGRDIYNAEQRRIAAERDASDRRSRGNEEYSVAQRKYAEGSEGLQRAAARLRKKHGPLIQAAEEVVRRIRAELERDRKKLQGMPDKVVVLDRLDIEQDIDGDTHGDAER